MTTKTKRILSAVVGVYAGAAAWVYSDLWLGTYLANFVQASAFYLTGFVLLILGGAAVWIALGVADQHRRSTRRSHWDVYSRATADTPATDAPRTKPVVIGGALLAVLGLGLAVYSIGAGGYLAKQRYLEHVTVVQGAHPALEERPAYDLAVARRDSDKDQIRGSFADTSYLADKGTYGSLLKSTRRFYGYAGTIEQSMSLTGDTDVTTCLFDEDHAPLRLGGWFSHSMARQLAHVERGLIASDEDAYGYCEDGTPMVVVPLKKLEGWFPAIEVPAGVAIYNGTTGDLQVHDSLAAGTVPGSVYPASIARRQREALAAHDASYFDYFFGRAGWSDATGDEGDPNVENPSEFALRTTDNDNVLVTPLTIRSKAHSTRIAALSFVGADTVTADQLNELTIYVPEERREANSTVVDTMRTDYADLPDWAAGMHVFEIMPVTSTEWVASLGFKKNISYRVRLRVSEDGDATSCLEDAEGTVIRCGRVTATNGNGPGVSLAPGNPVTGTTPVPLPANVEELKKLSDTELAQLQEQLTGELVRRLDAAKQ